MNKPRYLIIHHSAVSREVQPNQFLPINNYHKEKWNFKSELSLYGGYHYLIEPNGEIKQYRKETEIAAHTKGMNDRSIGIGLAGNFNIELPTQGQKESLRKLLKELTKRWDIPVIKIVPHRHFSRTDCFGKRLKNDWAQQLIAQEYQKSDNKQEIELLKKQITIIEKLIQVYIKLLDILFTKKRSDN